MCQYGKSFNDSGCLLLLFLKMMLWLLRTFQTKVKLRLQRLPKDWDLLYLGGCYQRFGERYDVGLLQSRGGLCTYGYVITAKGARHLLQRAVLHSEKPIDHVLDDETLRGRVIAFHAEPPLVFVERTKETLSHTKVILQNLAVVQRFCMSSYTFH